MIGATIRKDTALLLRDRGALISLFALPVVFMAVFGATFQLGGDRAPPPGQPWPAGQDPFALVTGFQVAVPGNAVLFGFFLSLTVAVTFARERRSGTWRRLLAAPVPRWRALVATLVPYFLIGLAQLAFLFTTAVLGFGMAVHGSWFALVALSVGVAYCAVALGLVFAAVGGGEKQLAGVGAVVLLLMGMVGGCMIPRLVMPELMQQLGLAVPHAWALDGLYAVLVRPGTTLADVAPALGALAGFGTAFVVFGALRFRFDR